MAQDRRDIAYDKIMDYEQNVHERNQKRIKLGIQLLLIIPLIFLAIMFRMESNKVVFLTLWIVSLFIISIYLICVEYMDFQLQVKLHEFGLREETPIQGLISEDSKLENVILSAVVLDEQIQGRRLALEEHVREAREKVDNVQSRARDERIIIEQDNEGTIVIEQEEKNEPQIAAVTTEEMIEARRKAQARRLEKKTNATPQKTYTLTEDELVEGFRAYLSTLDLGKKEE